MSGIPYFRSFSFYLLCYSSDTESHQPDQPTHSRGTQSMSPEERSTLVSIVVNILVDLFIIIKLYGLWQSGAFDGPEALQTWARAVLWAVPLAIGGTILLSILAAMVQKVVSGESEKAAADERDHRYQLRGMAVTMVVACFGVMAGIIALALGKSAIFGLTVIYFSMAAGALVGDIVRLLSYRVWG